MEYTGFVKAAIMEMEPEVFGQLKTLLGKEYLTLSVIEGSDEIY